VVRARGPAAPAGSSGVAGHGTPARHPPVRVARGPRCQRRRTFVPPVAPG
jgi:hypothetical protein